MAKLRSTCLTDGATGLTRGVSRVKVAERIDLCTQRETATDCSMYQLGDQLEAKYIDVRRATEKAAARRQDDRELRELSAGKKDMVERAAALSGDIEDLTVWHDQLASIDADLSKRRTELSRLREVAAELTVLAGKEDDIDPRLLGLTTQDDRNLRDKLEDYAVEREKLVRAVDEAKERSATSSAAYEALLEIDENDSASARRSTRTAQTIVSILLPVAFMVAGIPLFIHGRQINSLSFTVFGIGLVILAFFLAAAAIVVLFRPNKDAEALENRQKDAHWVMLQDKKLLDARIAERDQLDAELQALFARYGLEGADGSIRQALLLLDDAQEARARMAERRQRAMAQEMHESSASQAVADLEEQRRAVEEAAGLEPDAPLRTLEAALRAKEDERDELNEKLEGAGKRLAELKRSLDAAKEDRTFDRVKLDYHQIRARLRIAATITTSPSSPRSSGRLKAGRRLTSHPSPAREGDALCPARSLPSAIASSRPPRRCA